MANTQTLQSIWTISYRSISNWLMSSFLLWMNTAIPQIFKVPRVPAWTKLYDTCVWMGCFTPRGGTMANGHYVLVMVRYM